jgi:hypothetical protein
MRLSATKSVTAVVFMGKAKRMAEFMDSDRPNAELPLGRVRRATRAPAHKGEVKNHPTLYAAQCRSDLAHRRIDIGHSDPNGLSPLREPSARHPAEEPNSRGPFPRLANRALHPPARLCVRIIPCVPAHRDIRTWPERALKASQRLRDAPDELLRGCSRNS